jgi:uncharacterized membrane protein YtjA (UPF0391 family)
MYCQKCGSENLENATMCQSCGGVFVFSKPARTSGMAVTSMILGISGFSMLGVFGITWIIGLVFGIIALNRMGKSSGQLKGKGFAITGIATSAAGLALLLTVIGVLLFVNSATMFSLSRKLRMHSDITASVPIGQKPGIEGLVCILNDKTNPDDKCTAVLFVFEQSAADYFLTCGPKGKEPVKLSWQFSGKKEQADRYNFTITVPVGENATGTSKKTIVYDGKEQIIFEDTQRKIYIRPKE